MPRIVLTITTGALAGQRLEYNQDRVTIGRRDTNNVVLAPDDVKASSDHCELRFQAGSWVLADRASTNGTFVDGKEISHSVPVSTGLLFECGEGGPILMVELPDDEAALSPGKPVTLAPPAPAGTVMNAKPAAGAPSQAAFAPVGPSAGEDGHGPSTGRTAFYMALMTDKVQKSSKKLKIMIGVMAVLLIGVVAFAVIMALKVDEGETKQAKLESELKTTGEKLKETGDKLDKTDKALEETKKALAAAESKMKTAREQLATTSGKLVDLRLAIKKAEGDAKKKLEAQALKLEKTRKEYEQKLKTQEAALTKLKQSRGGGEAIAKAMEKALYMLIAPTPSGEFGFCTAFAIDKSGLLATNSHCLRMVESLKVANQAALARMNRDPSKTYRVIKWRGHPKHKKLLSEDVALLWVDTGGQPLPVATRLAANDKVRTKLGSGMAVYTMGFPGKVMNERQPAADFRAAVISRLTDFSNGPGNTDTARVVWHSALTSKGTSGSPIFDADGEVIAVNTGGLSARTVEVQDAATGSKKKQVVYDATGLNFGIRIDALRELFGTDVKLTAPGPATP